MFFNELREKAVTGKVSPTSRQCWSPVRNRHGIHAGFFRARNWIILLLLHGKEDLGILGSMDKLENGPEMKKGKEDSAPRSGEYQEPRPIVVPPLWALPAPFASFQGVASCFAAGAVCLASFPLALLGEGPMPFAPPCQPRDGVAPVRLPFVHTAQKSHSTIPAV